MSYQEILIDILCDLIHKNFLEFLNHKLISQNILSAKSNLTTEMSHLAQICSRQGHEDNKVKYVCLEVNCQIKRLFCLQCMLDNHHKHGYDNNKHLVDQKGLQQFIQKQIEYLQNKSNQQLNDSFIQQCIPLIRSIQLQINKILDTLKSQIKYYIQKNVQNLQQQLQRVKETKLNQIEDKFINELINLDLSQNRQHMIDQIKQYCQILMKDVGRIEQITEQDTQDTQIFKVNNLQFEMTQIDDQGTYAATISSDLKYIVFCRNDFRIKIIDYQSYKVIHEISHFDKVRIAKFTDDNSLLYFGTGQGLLCCYNVNNNFNQIFKEKIHNNNILNIYCISNTIILTSSYDKYIRKTDIERNQKQLCFQAHDEGIDGLDYNQQEDVIASCSIDNFIKIWSNRNAELLIKHQNLGQSTLCQVLFLHNRKIISLDSKDNIKIWQIKFETKELILINTINSKNKIFNLSLVLNHSILLLICSEYIYFNTLQGQYVKQIQHDVQEFCLSFNLQKEMFSGRQLDSMKAILIQGKSIDIKLFIEQLMILKAKN